MGREHELATFRAALRAEVPPFSVMHVHGPGGVGKTALLDRFAAAARAEGVPVMQLDLRHCGATPTTLEDAFRRAAHIKPEVDLSSALAEVGRVVALVDTYEAAKHADAWVRETLLPALPETILVVLAGREPPTEGWRADAGWRDLLHVVALGNLGFTESRAYLVEAGIQEPLHTEVIELSHGHPLALALLADIIEQQGSLGAAGLSGEPDVLRALLTRFTEGIPAPQHRHALEACALVRTINEPLLRVALGIDEIGVLFDWLRGLCFIQESRHGLTVHDLARDVLEADLRWRDPDRYQRMRRRLGRQLLAELRSASGNRQRELLFDVKFLHRGSPSVRGLDDWDAVGQVELSALRDADRELIVAMTRRHEGAESAGWAEFWLDRQPDAFTMFRGEAGLLGYCCYLILDRARADDREADPATRAVWQFAHRVDPPETGDEITFNRFMIDAETYQGSSPVFSQRVTVAGRMFFTRPRLAWDFHAFAVGYEMGEEHEYFDYAVAQEAGFSVGGREYLVYARNWKRSPLAAWARTVARKGTTGATASPDAAARLSRDAFDAAVKAALRGLARPNALADNPLLTTSLAGAGAVTRGTDVLASRIRQAAESLRGHPREEKYYRALDRTYLRPAPTQEQAAELLGLPMSTFRRHLVGGVARLADILWHEAHAPSWDRD